jgi:lipopolysaccharide biosynthesis glycosyltransferase
MTAHPKTIVITASDEQYVTLARDLFASLRALRFQGEFDIGMLDVGLAATSREEFVRNNIKVETAQSDIDFPARELWEKEKPGFRTLTARPFLRRYFPGYDVYIWIDADVWVQTPEAIDTLIACASRSPAIHIACELDRSYKTFFQSAAIWQIFRDWYQANYGEAIASTMTLKPMLNAGVFAMSKDSPLWDAWRDIYTGVLQKQNELTTKAFMADQLGLNILLYMQNMPYELLPATFNWLTFYALPKFDPATGLYVEPSPPYRPISHIHLTRPIKIQVEKFQCLDGTEVERPLTFSGRKG